MDSVIVQDGPYAGQPALLFYCWDDLMEYSYYTGFSDGPQLVAFEENGDWVPMVVDGDEMEALVPVPDTAFHIEAVEQGSLHALWDFAGYRSAVYKAYTAGKKVKRTKWLTAKTKNFLLKAGGAGILLGGTAVILNQLQGVLYPTTDWYTDPTTGVTCASTGGRLCCINPETQKKECEGNVTPTTDLLLYMVIGVIAIGALMFLSRRD